MTSPPAPSPAAAPRSSWQLLTDRTFGPWFWGNVTSNSGNWLFNVTAAIVVFELSGSALLVGMVSVAQFLPLVLLSPLAGAISDRVDRRRLLLASQAFAATAAATIAVAAAVLGIDGLGGPWPVLAAAFGIGLGQAVAAPTLNALVPALVEDQDLEGAIGLTSSTFNIGRALGPATSGLLLATVGAETAFVVNAASFVVLIVALLVIRTRPSPRGSGDRSVRAGLAFVRRTPALWMVLLGVGALGFAADPMITLAPPLAAELDGGDTLVATMVSSFGIAASIAALWFGRLQRATDTLSIAAGAAGILALGLTTVAAAPVAGVAIAGFAVTGVGFVLGVAGLTTVLQRRTPDELRGRVMALWTVAFLGNRPVAAAIDGAVADLIGPRLAMILAIAMALTAGWVALRLRRDATGQSRRTASSGTS